jgi:hypothetical protein
MVHNQNPLGAVTARCRFIGSHDYVGFVAATAKTVTACGFWTRGKQFGWRVETLPADWQSVPDWLGY